MLNVGKEGMIHNSYQELSIMIPATPIPIHSLLSTSKLKSTATNSSQGAAAAARDTVCPLEEGRQLGGSGPMLSADGEKVGNWSQNSRTFDIF